MVKAPSADFSAPQIIIRHGSAGTSVRQNRPVVSSVLAGMRVREALALLPALLPVCGEAQGFAARNAVAAARQETVAEEGGALSMPLWREQAFAAAWRHGIDWCDELGEVRDLDGVARVRQAGDDRRRSIALAALAPGLEAVRSLDQLLDWMRESDCTAARVAREAMDSGRPLAAARCLGGEPLARVAETVLDSESYDPQAPSADAVDVGPLAMQRDPLVAALQDELGSTLLARRLAQVLELRVIARALAGGERQGGSMTSGWSTDTRAGMGRAVTARGPVFHRVRLETDRDTVADWRVLAPTDWHFSPAGPVAKALPAMANPSAIRSLVGAFDPCAPWALQPPVDAG